MAIQTEYKFSGITVPNAIIRIVRLWGSSKSGWDSLVEVTHLVDEQEVKVTEFNHQAEHKEDERGYETLYKSLMEKFGGTEYDTPEVVAAYQASIAQPDPAA